MTYDRSMIEQDEEGGGGSIPSSILFNNDMLRWQPQSHQQQGMDYQTNTSTTTANDLMPLQAVVSSTPSSMTSPITASSTTAAPAATSSTTTSTPVPAINTTNPNIAPPPPILDPTKQYHPEWGVIKDGDFHALTLKHQRDLENHYQTNDPIADFYFWQANLGGYCMANMVEGNIKRTRFILSLYLYAFIFLM